MRAVANVSSVGIGNPHDTTDEGAISIRKEKSPSTGAEWLDLALESIVRRKLPANALPQGTSFASLDVRVRLACSSEEQSAADRFVAMRYAWRGYVADRESEGQSPEKGAALNYFTLLAYREDRIVGTLTVGVDSCTGLLVDKANRQIVDGLRRTGRRVVELRRLSVCSDVGAKAVLAHLFSAAYLVGRILHDATDVLIEVNPRHASFYRRIFGFVLLRGEWICARVNAPAVLLHLDIANLDRKLRHFGAGDVLEPAAAWQLCGLSPTLPFSSPAGPGAGPGSNSASLAPSTSTCPYVDASGCCKVLITR
jgi:hypothetical protein